MSEFVKSDNPTTRTLQLEVHISEFFSSQNNKCQMKKDSDRVFKNVSAATKIKHLMPESAISWYCPLEAMCPLTMFLSSSEPTWEV